MHRICVSEYSGIYISSRGWLVNILLRQNLKVLVCWWKSLYKLCHVETAASFVRVEWRSRDIITQEGKVYIVPLSAS